MTAEDVKLKKTFCFIFILKSMGELHFSFSNLMGPLPPMWSVLTKTSGTSCLCIYDVHYDLQFQASTGVLEHIFHGTWGTPVLICIFPLLHCDNVDNSVILKR